MTLRAETGPMAHKSAPPPVAASRDPAWRPHGRPVNPRWGSAVAADPPEPAEDARCAILIPTYNCAGTVQETLRALQACSGLDRVSEGVFLIDNASSDASIEAAKAAWTHPSPLTIWRNEQNLGHAGSVNKAFEMLRERCEWAFLLHADDLPLPDWIDLHLNRASRAGPKVALICSSFDAWHETKNTIVRGENENSRLATLFRGEPDLVSSTLLEGCWWRISGSLMHLGLFADSGRFRVDLTHYHDFEWLVRLLHQGLEIEYIPRVTQIFRDHERSLSNSALAASADLQQRLMIYREYTGLGCLSDRERDFLRRQMLNVVARRLLRQVSLGNLHRLGTLLDIGWRAFAI